MINESVKVELDSDVAEAKARRFGQVMDDAMARGEAAANRASAATGRLGDTQAKTANRVHQLRMGMFQLGSSMAITGGRTGMLINAFAEMGAMMLSGGVLGMGIGLITAGFSILSMTMKSSGEEAQKLWAILISGTDVTRRLRETIEGIESSVARSELFMVVGEGRGKELLLEQNLRQLYGKRDEAISGVAARQLAEGEMPLDEETARAAVEAEALLDTIMRTIRARERELAILREQNRLAAEKSGHERFAREHPGRLRSALDRAKAIGISDDDVEAERLRLEGAEVRRANIIYGLEERINAGKEELRLSHLKRMADIEEKSLEESMERYQRWGDFTANVFGTLADSSLTYFEDMVAGEEMAGEKMVASVLKSIGRQLVGMGTKDVLEGTARMIRSYGADPSGPALIAQGGIELATGLAMGAGGAYISGARTAELNSRQDAGVGGSSPAGDRFGDTGDDEKGGVTIIVQGPFTADETAAMIDRGIAEARGRGLR